VLRPRLTARNAYWDLAHEYRRRHGLLERNAFNQNIAVLLLENGEPIVERNEEGLHSEQRLSWQLKDRSFSSDCPIVALFSERKPCSSVCQKTVLPQFCRINNHVAYDIFFVIDYYNSPEGVKSENNRHELIKSYSRAGYF
jgi:hypothetical protein